MYMYVGRLQTARVEGMMHIGETEEWENWKLFYIDHVTLYRIKFNRKKKKKRSGPEVIKGFYHAHLS